MADLTGATARLSLAEGGPGAMISGDTAGADFEAVYRAHCGRIYAICLRMTADPGRAEELTQETFVRAFRKLDTYRGEADISAWLRRVAVNVVLSEGRVRGRRLDRELELDDEARLPAPRPLSGDGRAIDLEKAIARLPDGARTVFVLYAVEGYTHAEVGEALGISPTTSKTQLHRARRLLREALSS